MNIKKIRKSKDMTQQDLAKAIGVDHTIVSKYEKGLVIPPTGRLEAIARVLGVSIETLLNEDSVCISVPDKGKERVNQEEVTPIPWNVLRRILIKHNNGMCELCGSVAPFKTEDDVPFLELQWIKPLSEGGKNALDNAVVLCPVCNRKLQMLKNPDDIRKLENIAKNREY